MNTDYRTEVEMNIHEFILVLYIAMGVFSFVLMLAANRVEFTKLSLSQGDYISFIASSLGWFIALPLWLFLCRRAIFGKNRMPHIERLRNGVGEYQ